MHHTHTMFQIGDVPPKGLALCVRTDRHLGKLKKEAHL